MCEQPQPPINGILGDVSSSLAGSIISFQCNEGLFPPGQLSATCSDLGKWQPNPAKVNCTSEPACEQSIHAILLYVCSNVVLLPQSLALSLQSQ